MAAVVVLAVWFAVTMGVVCLRFMSLARQMVDSLRLDHRENAVRLDSARAGAFTDAMTALERVTSSQAQAFERTVDLVAGPQVRPGGEDPLAVDAPSLDARVRWQPDDEWDYSALGIDPTDDLMPDPPLEPEGNEGRATMVRPGEGLV